MSGDSQPQYRYSVAQIEELTALRMEVAALEQELAYERAAVLQAKHLLRAEIEFEQKALDQEWQVGSARSNLRLKERSLLLQRLRPGLKTPPLLPAKVESEISTAAAAAAEIQFSPSPERADQQLIVSSGSHSPQLVSIHSSPTCFIVMTPVRGTTDEGEETDGDQPDVRSDLDSEKSQETDEPLPPLEPPAASPAKLHALTHHTAPAHHEPAVQTLELTPLRSQPTPAASSSGNISGQRPKIAEEEVRVTDEETAEADIVVSPMSSEGEQESPSAQPLGSPSKGRGDEPRETWRAQSARELVFGTRQPAPFGSPR